MSQFAKEQKYTSRSRNRRRTRRKKSTSFISFRSYIYYRPVPLISIQIFCANRPLASVCDTNKVSCEPGCRLQRVQCLMHVSSLNILYYHQLPGTSKRAEKSFAPSEIIHRAPFCCKTCFSRLSLLFETEKGFKQTCHRIGENFALSNQESRFLCVSVCMSIVNTFGNSENEFALYLGVDRRWNDSFSGE